VQAVLSLALAHLPIVVEMGGWALVMFQHLSLASPQELLVLTLVVLTLVVRSLVVQPLVVQPLVVQPLVQLVRSVVVEDPVLPTVLLAVQLRM
jgi:hypothetical protein